jgi:hypothetical protein
MTLTLMNEQLQKLNRRVRMLERKVVEDPLASLPSREKTRAAFKAAYGIWAKNPRTPADLKKLRKRLGYD